VPRTEEPGIDDRYSAGLVGPSRNTGSYDGLGEVHPFAEFDDELVEAPFIVHADDPSASHDPR